MDTTFMISENNKTSDHHWLLLNLLDKVNFKKWYFGLSNLSIYYTWKNIKKSYKNNKFKISAPTYNDGSLSVSGIRDYFKYIIRKHQKGIKNPPIRIYISKIENRFTFRIKARYYL